MPPATGVRQRARAETMAALTAVARRHLGEHGAAALSVRAVAREMGVVSSAVYRYVRSRDELLTLLIVDAYDAVGATAEAALAASRHHPPGARWVAVGGAIREWALANPHEYALVYGSPVPGYTAPQTTIGPATRTSLALVTIVADAYAAGAIAERGGGPADPAAVLPALRADAQAICAALGVDLPDDLVVRILIAWTQLFGLVGFELFGQTRNVITDHTALFDTALAAMAGYIGLT